MAEQLITGLSQSPDTYVTARTTSFASKGKSMTARQIAEQLGVRYFARGQCAGDADRVRINVQLIDGISGNHIWADHFDRKFEDLFALSRRDNDGSDGIFECQIQRRRRGELEILRGPTTSRRMSITSGAYTTISGATPKTFQRRANCMRRRSKLDPGFGPPTGCWDFVHADEVWFRIAKSPENSLEEAEKAATNA